MEKRDIVVSYEIFPNESQRIDISLYSVILACSLTLMAGTQSSCDGEDVIAM